jgi:hypothetical protein
MMREVHGIPYVAMAFGFTSSNPPGICPSTETMAAVLAGAVGSCSDPPAQATSDVAVKPTTTAAEIHHRARIAIPPISSLP